MGKGKKPAREYKSGSIFRRGSRYYYENKSAGIPPRSLGTTDYQTARERVKERFGWAQFESERRRYEELIRKHEETAGNAEAAKSEKLPLDSVFEQYKQVLKIKSKNGNTHAEASTDSPLAPKTLRTTAGIVDRFVSWIKDNKPDIQTMDEVTPQVAEKYFMAFRDTGCPASTYNRHLADLRSVWKRLAIQAGLSSNPFEQIEAMKRNQVSSEASPKDRFSLDQLRIMQEKATGWVRPAMFIGYYTGLRLSDVVTLKWEWVDIEDGFIQIPGIRKNSKPKLIYSPEVMPALREWGKESKNIQAPTSTKAAKDLGLSRSSAYKLIHLENAPDAAAYSDINEYYRALCAAGIQAGMQSKALWDFLEKPAQTDISRKKPKELDEYVFPDLAAAVLGIGRKKDESRPSKEFQRFLADICNFNTRNDAGKTVLGFHSLRVSHATYSKISGVSEEEIQEDLLHSNRKTTEGYIRTSVEEKKRELRQKHTALPSPGKTGVDTEAPESLTDKAKRLLDSASEEQVQEVLQVLSPEKPM